MKKFLIIAFIVIGVVFLGFLGKIYLLPKLNGENRQIDAWIKANNLNKYGAAQNTAYSNGPPICSSCDRYDYIKQLYPNKPWQTPQANITPKN